MLEVRLIGTFAIQYDGKPVTIPSRHAQSLFAYLILTTGTSHRREKLAGMFWPDATEEKARAYLRHEVWTIRKALPKNPKIDYLIVDDINITFNLSAEYRLDTTNLTETRGSLSVDYLMNAVAAYHGDLLPGFYDEWILLEREHLRAEYEQKMGQLLGLFEKEKRWNDILEWAEQWISVGQGSETAYRYLMVAYDALGDQTKVASTYKRCVQTLRELELEPSEQTRALAFKRTSKLNIPIPLTSFIGREKELKEVTDLLSKSRLVTLTGSGGVGKTRLAIQVIPEVIERFPDGIWFLDLAPLSDPALVPSLLANMLGLRESGELPVTDLLINYFCSRIALVIFDNCEHLIDSCVQLVHLLMASCEHLSVLATSRESLRISGEMPYRVPSLETPKLDIEFAIDEFSNMESVRLFTERARVISPGFVISSRTTLVISKICQRLDGIPLAIELAAAQVNILSVEEILKRLDNRFKLLTNGWRSALPRHQTLGTAIDWSYNLLSGNEQVLLSRLSVFAGGWTLEAAESVCEGGLINTSDILNLMGQLIYKSLVIKEEVGDGSRYRMLETIRQYANEKLITSGGNDAIRNKHLAYFVKLTARAEPELYRSNQVFWLNKLDDELDNLRRALMWGLGVDVEAGLRLMVASRFFWEAHGDFREVEGWLEQFLEHYKEPDPLRAKTLVIYGRVLADRGFIAEAQNIAYQSLELSHRISDKQAEAFSLWGLGVIIGFFQSDLKRGIPVIEQSLALYKSLGDVLGQATALDWLSIDHNDPERAKAYMFESLKLYRELGHLLGIGMCLMDLASLMIDTGDFSSPKPLLEEAHMVYRQLENLQGEAWALMCDGRLASWQCNYQQAYTCFEQSIALYEKIGILWSFWPRIFMAYAFLRQGDIVQARATFEISLLQVQRDDIAYGLINVMEGFASLHVNQGQLKRAARLFAWADAMREKMGAPRPPIEQHAVNQDLAVIQSELNDTELEKLMAEARAMTEEQALTVALKQADEL